MNDIKHIFIVPPLGGVEAGEAFDRLDSALNAVVRDCGESLTYLAVNRLVHLVKGKWQTISVVETRRQNRSGADEVERKIETALNSHGFGGAQDGAKAAQIFEVEEHVVIGPASDGPPSYKYLGFYCLPEETNGERFWKYHTEVHAVHSVDSFGGLLKKYVINRVTRQFAGEPSAFGLVELWFDGPESMREGFKAHDSVILPDGVSVSEDFNRQVTGAFGMEAEERVVKTES